MDKIYNFSAEASALPEEVGRRVREQAFNYKKSGVSVMELVPGSKEYTKLLKDAESTLRKILDLPIGYSVLFVAAPLASQYSAIPLNLMSDHKCADYIVTGQSSKAAEREAKKYGDIHIAAISAGADPIFSTVPKVERSDFRPDADYAYLCYNDSIYGTKFPALPDTGNIPLVVDMTSSLLSEPIDFTRTAMLIAGGEGNICVPGLTLVVIRADLLGNPAPETPSMMNYKHLADKRNLEFAPSALSLFIAKEIFSWIASVGGLEEMKRRSEKKASVFYDFLDGYAQDYFTSSTDRNCRSMTTVVFTTGDSELDRKFIAEAAEAGFINLGGDSSIGGMRACIHNSMTIEGVLALVEFMKTFKNNNPRFEI